MARCERRVTLVDTLKGQTMRIPDFESIFAGWPRATNQHLEWLRSEVDSILRCIVVNRWPAAEQDKALRGLRKADFGLFGAFWWPWTCKRTLRTMSLFVIWLFLWDDEIDAEVGALASDFAKAQKYRCETLDFVKKWLGLTDDVVMPTHPNILINSFATIGREALHHGTYDQRNKLYDEIKLYMNASEVEQRRRLQSSLPSVEKYWECRMGTSAVGACLALLEYSHALTLPRGILADRDMVAMWDRTNTIISGTNDILSLKKELANDTPDSLIPLLYSCSRSLDEAIAQATLQISKARAEFDGAASSLWARYGPNADVHLFITACKANCTGNLSWSLLTGRYGLDVTLSAGHATVIL